MAEEEHNTDFAVSVKEQEKRTTDWASTKPVSTRGKRTFIEKNQSNFSKSEVRSYSDWSLKRIDTFKESKKSSNSTPTRPPNVIRSSVVNKPLDKPPILVKDTIEAVSYTHLRAHET